MYMYYRTRVHSVSKFPCNDCDLFLAPLSSTSCSLVIFIIINISHFLTCTVCVIIMLIFISIGRIMRILFTPRQMRRGFSARKKKAPMNTASLIRCGLLMIFTHRLGTVMHFTYLLHDLYLLANRHSYMNMYYKLFLAGSHQHQSSEIREQNCADQGSGLKGQTKSH